MFPKLKFGFNDPQVKKVMKLMVPTLFGSSIAQINLLLDTLIAVWLPIVGSVSFLYYSDRLLEFPLGVFAIAISTVILPTLSRQFAKNDSDKFVKTMRWALNLGFFIAIPAAVGMFMLAQEIVTTLFQYGNFTINSAYYTALSLMAYMLALPAFVLNKILLPAFYARKDTKTPVKIGVISMFSNMVFNFMIVAILWHFEFVALHVGLALASALSAWMQTFLLYRALLKQKILPIGAIQWSIPIKIFIASSLMALCLSLLLSTLGIWAELLWYRRAINLLMCISVGIFVYIITLMAMKVEIKNHMVSN
jgi:putative peptidoglycan lipid II flippase